MKNAVDEFVKCSQIAQNICTLHSVDGFSLAVSRAALHDD